MRFKEEFRPIGSDRAIPKFKGRTILEEFDMDTGEVKNKLEKDNAFTGYVYGVLGRGNYNGLISISSLLPIRDKMLGGIICTNEENDVDEMMIASDAEITACAGNDAYTSQGSTPRGSFSAENSGHFEDEIGSGYQNCFMWTDRQGFENGGVIKSVGLTKPHIGAAPSNITDGSSLPDLANFVDVHFSTGTTVSDTFKALTYIDFDNSRGYRVTYDGTSGSEKVSVKVYEFNGDVYHLEDTSLGVGRELTDEEFDVSVVLNKAAFCYGFERKTGHLHIINFTANSGSVDILDLDITNKTGTKTAHTFPDVQIVNPNLNHSYGGYSNYGMFISDGYFYCLSHSNSKIMKCDLSNDANVIDVTNPLNSFLGPAVVLENGDIMWVINYDGNTRGIWFHNGTWRIFCISGPSGYGQRYMKFFINKYGLIMAFKGANHQIGSMNFLAIFPYLSTVNNLVDEEHPSGFVRTPGLGLKITYKVYESES